jgi:predicted DNA-binding protein (UPF0251 family)
MPAAPLFKPAGIPARLLEEVVLALDELEAIRLADLQGLYQEQAAERMRISRPTFGRIIDSGHRKVAEALIMGKALRIEGGPVVAESPGVSRCPSCEEEWIGAAGGPLTCPRCRRGEADAKQTEQVSRCRFARERRSPE